MENQVWFRSQVHFTSWTFEIPIKEDKTYLDIMVATIDQNKLKILKSILLFMDMMPEFHLQRRREGEYNRTLKPSTFYTSIVMRYCSIIVVEILCS